jgi:arginyl-tRNA synthetase
VDRTLEPHRLVSFVHSVASAFTAFYDACPILKAEPSVRRSRLRLTRLAATTLSRGLELLGISVPERM